jgi:alpha-L-fucosidase 2
MQWKDGQITRVEVLSQKGQPCRINLHAKVKVTTRGKSVENKRLDDGTIEFNTEPGERYTLVPSDA